MAAVHSLARLAPKVKPVGVGPVADLFRFPEDGLRQGLAGMLPGKVNGLPVSRRDAGHVIGRLGPALDLQAGNARVYHLRDVVDHP